MDTGPGSENETGGGGWAVPRRQRLGKAEREMEEAEGGVTGRWSKGKDEAWEEKGVWKIPAPNPHLTTGSSEKELDWRSMFTGWPPLPEGPSAWRGLTDTSPHVDKHLSLGGCEQQVDCRSVAAGKSHWNRVGALLGGGGALLQLASAYQPLYPSPTSRGYYGDDPSFPIGPVVSSTASFTFFFCFSPLFFPLRLPHPQPLSHMHRSSLKKAGRKPGTR